MGPVDRGRTTLDNKVFMSIHFSYSVPVLTNSQQIKADQTVSDDKKDVFQDQDKDLLPSPPFDFRELSAPPAVEQGQKDIISRTQSTNIENNKPLDQECASNKVTSINKRNSAKKLVKTTTLNSQMENRLLKSGKESITTNKSIKESVGKTENYKDDICEKCHHRKGKLRSKSVQQKDENIKQANDSKFSKRQQQEEKEILKRYILVGVTKDNLCNCLDHVDKTFKV